MSPSSLRSQAFAVARQYAAERGENLLTTFGDSLSGDVARMQLYRRLRRAFPDARAEMLDVSDRGGVYAMTRNWAHERWRKQYLREPLQERLWPVRARGVRELLNKLAEEDGMLVRDAEDPLCALVAALAPKPEELELVRAAVALLVHEGFLGSDGRSIWIPELPAAQTFGDLTRGEPDVASGTQHPGPPRQPSLSTERVSPLGKASKGLKDAGKDPRKGPTIDSACGPSA